MSQPLSARPRPVVVIGGGIVGLATAYRLLGDRPGTPVIVLEKEPAVGRHQSGHNSGVLHAGLAYEPGSRKARLATAGVRLMRDFCERHDIQHDICGKVVVAATPDELPRLRAALERGRANGLAGLAWLDPSALRELEPHVSGAAAIRVPEEGIVDYPGVCRRLATEIVARGGEVRLNAGVRALRRTGSAGDAGWIAETTDGAVEGAFLVACAGLQSDRVALMAGEHPTVRIVPFRGEYYRLRPDRCDLVRHLVYPLPDPSFPFLGVHFTRRVGGGVDCGPNAVLALAREGYDGRPTVSARDAASALGYPGLWHFLRRHPGQSWHEVRQSLSRARFTAALQRLVPDVRADDLLPGGAGVRAQAMHPDGTLEHDFVFVDAPAALHVLNAPSPGATASLAIAGEIVERIVGRS
ncbi:MAG: L-2-hydroxyglutarate oxidase [Gemmatimonadaceae bacterium]